MVPKNFERRVAVSADTPISSLIESIQKLKFDGENLTELVPELTALKTKLPAEIKSGDDAFLDSSSAKMAELRTEIQEMLISKLLQHGGER